jgi:hypothetical protein
LQDGLSASRNPSACFAIDGYRFAPPILGANRSLTIPAHDLSRIRGGRSRTSHCWLTTAMALFCFAGGQRGRTCDWVESRKRRWPKHRIVKRKQTSGARRHSRRPQAGCRWSRCRWLRSPSSVRPPPIPCRISVALPGRISASSLCPELTVLLCRTSAASCRSPIRLLQRHHLHRHSCRIPLSGRGCGTFSCRRSKTSPRRSKTQPRWRRSRKTLQASRRI